MSDETFATHERRGWNRNAAAYDEIDLPTTVQAFGPMLDSLGRLNGVELLEIAAGTGQLARQALQRGATVTGIDVAPNMVAVAQVSCPGATFREADAEALPFDDGAFDAALCCFGLLHMEHPERAIREAARVLRPAGRFAFTVWASPENGNEFFGRILGAYQAHANFDVGLPPAPPMFELAEPAGHEPVLRGAGFGDITIAALPIEWPLNGRETIMDFVEKGGVRTRMLHERQTADVQQRIREVFLDCVDEYVAAGRDGIPCPAVLVCATKA